MFIILISIVFISAAGMSYLILRNLKEVRMMSENEFLMNLQSSRPVFSDFYHYIIIPTINFWQISLLPKIYKEFEKLIARFRINLLKIEGWLLKLTNYVRGKRKIHNNGNSPYWKDINDFKNGLK